MDVGRDTTGQDLGGNGGAVRLLIIARFVSRPADNLPAVTDEAGHRHSGVTVHSVDASAGGFADEHFVRQRLLHRQDDAVATAQAEGRAGVFHGFGGVFDLEDAAIRREGGGGEVVA